MRVEGVYSFKAGCQKAWAALLDPDVLAGCIPGCQMLKPVGQDAYEVVLKVGVAAISGTYTGRVAITEKLALESYKMLVEGSGAAGTIRGAAVLRFSENNGATEVRLDGDMQVSGVVARVGQRFLGSMAKMLMGQFFDCVRAKIEVQ